MGAHAVKMVPAEANAPRRQLWRQSCFVQANASSLNLEPKRCFDPSQRIQPKPWTLNDALINANASCLNIPAGICLAWYSVSRDPPFGV